MSNIQSTINGIISGTAKLLNQKRQIEATKEISAQRQKEKEDVNIRAREANETRKYVADKAVETAKLRAEREQAKTDKAMYDSDKAMYKAQSEEAKTKRNKDNINQERWLARQEAKKAPESPVEAREEVSSVNTPESLSEPSESPVEGVEANAGVNTPEEAIEPSEPSEKATSGSVILPGLYKATDHLTVKAKEKANASAAKKRAKYYDSETRPVNSNGYRKDVLTDTASTNEIALINDVKDIAQPNKKNKFSTSDEEYEIMVDKARKKLRLAMLLKAHGNEIKNPNYKQEDN